MKSGIASDAGAFGSEAKTSPQDTLVVDLADLVVPKQVQVVQELDLGKLSITLQSIVDAVNSIPAARPEDAPTRGDLDALHKEVEKLKEELKVKDTKIADLASKQVGLNWRGEALLLLWGSKLATVIVDLRL